MEPCCHGKAAQSRHRLVTAHISVPTAPYMLPVPCNTAALLAAGVAALGMGAMLMLSSEITQAAKPIASEAQKKEEDSHLLPSRMPAESQDVVCE